MNIDKSCTICSIDCETLKNQMNNFYQNNYHLNEAELYRAIYSLIQHHMHSLSRQNIPIINISEIDVENHFQNCCISKTNLLVRDIRVCSTLQKKIESNTTKKDINTWIKLSQLKLSLLNHIHQKNTGTTTTKPFDFS